MELEKKLQIKTEILGFIKNSSMLDYKTKLRFMDMLGNEIQEGYGELEEQKIRDSVFEEENLIRQGCY